MVMNAVVFIRQPDFIQTLTLYVLSKFKFTYLYFDSQDFVFLPTHPRKAMRNHLDRTQTNQMVQSTARHGLDASLAFCVNHVQLAVQPSVKQNQNSIDDIADTLGTILMVVTFRLLTAFTGKQKLLENSSVSNKLSFEELVRSYTLYSLYYRESKEQVLEHSRSEMYLLTITQQFCGVILAIATHLSH